MRIVTNLMAGLAVACSLPIVFDGAVVAQTAKKQPEQKAAVSITITQIPAAGPGESSYGSIAGVVKNAPKDSKVVIYSLGDTWYVQPWANAPFTEIARDGTWSATIHGGHEFAVFLVKPGYEPSSSTGTLPKVGGAILAMARAKRKP